MEAFLEGTFDIKFNGGIGDRFADLRYRYISEKKMVAQIMLRKCQAYRRTNLINDIGLSDKTL